MRRLVPPAIAALFVIALAADAAADSHVSVIALPTIPDLRGEAIDINQSGDVLVNCSPSRFPGTAAAYVWSKGVRTDINGPADTTGCVAINNARQVACNMNSSAAFLSKDGIVTSPAPIQSVGALNDRGFRRGWRLLNTSDA